MPIDDAHRHRIAEQICRNMRAGSDPQCRRVELAEVKPIAAGWGGALALGVGSMKVWFLNPEAGEWVTPEYFVMLVNEPIPEQSI